MTALVAGYRCAHCGDEFATRQMLGGHVHSNHPAHRRELPKFLTVVPEPRQRRSLKRATDSWPGRP